jgi:hypothetical protein
LLDGEATLYAFVDGSHTDRSRQPCGVPEVDRRSDLRVRDRMKVDNVAVPSGVQGLGVMCVVWSFAYFAFGRIVELTVLRFRRRESKEIEILVLRHELDILRR